MKKIGIIRLIIVVCIMSCVNEKSKKDYKVTTEVCSKLYVEVYTIFGSGALGGDLLTDYLTDSSNFRIFIGKYDNGNEIYTYSCDDGKVVIKKIFKSAKDNTKYLELKIYDLDSLKTTKSMQ